MQPKIDKNGNVLPTEKERTLIELFIYKYDSKGNLTEESFNYNGKLYYTIKYKYNKENLKTDEISINLGNKIKNTYKYDESGKMAGRIKYNLDKSKTYYKYSYELYKK